MTTDNENLEREGRSKAVKVMTLPTDVKAINLGCGTVIAPGWINIDNSPNARLSKYPPLRWLGWKLGVLSDEHYAIEWPESMIIRDLRKNLPFADSSIDYTYSSHLLEHLTLDDASNLLKEVLRVLKPGGLLRLVVPDLTYGARCYVDALNAHPTNHKAAPEFLSWLQLSRSGVRDPHLWMYDAPSLMTLLREAGFSKTRVCEHKVGSVPDCDILDNRPDESLHVEAAKP